MWYGPGSRYCFNISERSTTSKRLLFYKPPTQRSIPPRFLLLCLSGAPKLCKYTHGMSRRWRIQFLAASTCPRLGRAIVLGRHKVNILKPALLGERNVIGAQPLCFVHIRFVHPGIHLYIGIPPLNRVLHLVNPVSRAFVPRCHIFAMFRSLNGYELSLTRTEEICQRIMTLAWVGLREQIHKG